MDNRHRATLVLLIALAGFLVSTPFEDTFFGGLVASGCSAALIGGLADWFAVTALFRRPLGIPWRTAIIPRNRERIFEALVSMVKEELLSRETLKEQLNRYDLTEPIFAHLLGDGQKAEPPLGDMLAGMSTLLRERKVKDVLEEAARSLLSGLPLWPLLADSVEWALDSGKAGRVIDVVVGELEALVRHPLVKGELARLVRETRSAYESGMRRRRFFDDLVIGLAGKTPETQLIDSAAAFLDGFRKAGDPQRLRLEAQIRRWVDELRSDPQRQREVEAWKATLIQRLELGPLLTELLEDQGGRSGDDPPRWLKLLRSRLERLLTELRHDRERRQALDEMLKVHLFRWIDERHEEIGKLVQENLQSISDETLVELIESKAGNDLQMIRINGAVVGALAGMLLHLATLWLP
ncbi:conserved hypothetical protein [Heliomicrobium modesticaldum Ice1]|uniref:DUF445 domain-containing protein n=1 Tax=Heliobacterium modesticaldum (strain ATCC 51547 / Ice1) TaxID=498761 RepID=B0TE41_HELMI|nr:DUF445 domain-containing protein [Heliomicrobium modesticaldum]ABZ84236.1 conserved hypothetical protein [Heliomicrobium modesticaldum Ice1]